MGGTKACFFIGSRFDMADTYFLFVRFFRVFHGGFSRVLVGFALGVSRAGAYDDAARCVGMVRSVGQRLPVDCDSARAESRQMRTKRIKLLLIGEKELYEKFYPFVNVHGF